MNKINRFLSLFTVIILTLFVTYLPVDAGYYGYADFEHNPNSSGGARDGQICMIRNKKSKLYMDVAGGVAASGIPVIQSAFDGGYRQQWKIAVQSDGTCLLQSMLNTNYSLDVFSNTGNGSELKL